MSLLLNWNKTPLGDITGCQRNFVTPQSRHPTFFPRSSSYFWWKLGSKAFEVHQLFYWPWLWFWEFAFQNCSKFPTYQFIFYMNILDFLDFSFCYSSFECTHLLTTLLRWMPRGNMKHFLWQFSWNFIKMCKCVWTWPFICWLHTNHGSRLLPPLTPKVCFFLCA